MSKVYVLQVQGWGDDEDAFYNTGVYSTKAKALAAEKTLLKEAAADGMPDAVTQIEALELDA